MTRPATGSLASRPLPELFTSSAAFSEEAEMSQIWLVASLFDVVV